MLIKARTHSLLIENDKNRKAKDIRAQPIIIVLVSRNEDFSSAAA